MIKPCAVWLVPRVAYRHGHGHKLADVDELDVECPPLQMQRAEHQSSRVSGEQLETCGRDRKRGVFSESVPEIKSK